MKMLKVSSLQRTAALCLGIYSGLAAQAASIELPAASAVSPASVSERGFTVRTVQGPIEPVLANNLVRALSQLNGTLVDSEGTTVANEANSGPNADGSHFVDTINFEKDALEFDVVAVDNSYITSFIPGYFPGIPGIGGHTDNFATEVITYVELPAGETTFGISVGTDRTDVNNDDSFVVFSGANPRNYFNPQIAEFQRSAPPFVGNTHAESQFTVNAPVAGIYPFRIVHWQTGLGANLNFYTVDLNTGERVLVNDPGVPHALKAYRTSTDPDTVAPYVAQISPLGGSAGNNPAAPIEAVIFENGSTIQITGVKLFLNNVQVTPQSIVRADGKLVIKYTPNASRPDANNVVRLEYTDAQGTTRTDTWSFTITPASGSSTTVAGQWDFENGNLDATVGQALQYFDGPAGQTAAGTAFETTEINGAPAKVMHIPGDVTRQIGYVMTHGIPPNGGGTRVNQYTLIMDVLVAESGPGAASLLQVNPANTDDGDLFWQGNNFGQGTGGYNGTGQFTAGTWHRVVAAYDMAASPPVVTKYVDGIKQDDWTANQGLDNPRRALLPTAVLFADGDQDERREMWVNSIQIRAGKMSDAEIVLLGGPSAEGIPQEIPATSVTGQWDFNRGDLAATIGKNLSYFGGAEGLTATSTIFGTTTDMGIEDINGEAALVMHVPGDVTREIGYIMDHGIKPNGGGTRVNQYTLIMDVYVGTSGPGAASLLQTSSLENTDDGDLFWQGNNFGQGTGGYNGTGQFTAGAWHRVVAAYDMAATPPVVTKYVDGIKQDDWTANQSLDNPRRALQPTAILFADGDQDERREMWVNSIQIRAGKISDAEIVLLGGPSASGIPVAVPKPNVAGQWDFESGNLNATIGKPLQFFGGAEGLTQTATVFGTTTELGVANINGTEARIMAVPGDVTREIGYIMDHGIKPNGGGTRVNQYTLIMDVMVDLSGPGAASLLQISSLDNTDDGDLFWQGNNFGQGTGGYNGTSQFTAGEWHRVAAAYDMAATPPVVTKYVDGIKQDDWTANQSLDNPRRALQATAILFADGDQDERRAMWVNSIQICAGKLSDAELEALGGPSANGIPLLIDVPTPAELTVARNGENITISWPDDVTGYTLESTTALGTDWNEVNGVQNNSVTVPATGGGGFYRLKK